MFIEEAEIILLSMHCISNAVRYPSTQCAESQDKSIPKEHTAQVGSSVQVLAGLIISVGFSSFFISVILCSFCACYNLALFSLSHSCTVLHSK